MKKTEKKEATTTTTTAAIPSTVTATANPALPKPKPATSAMFNRETASKEPPTENGQKQLKVTTVKATIDGCNCEWKTCGNYNKYEYISNRTFGTPNKQASPFIITNNLTGNNNYNKNENTQSPKTPRFEKSTTLRSTTSRTLKPLNTKNRSRKTISIETSSFCARC